MAGDSMGVARRYLRELFRFGSTSPLSDGQLLARYAVAKEEDAFEALIERHGPMVMATCRAVLKNDHDVEDAFQATFLILARKAGSIHSGDTLASWLHRVAYRIAVQASIDAKRRRVRETKVATLAPAVSAEPDLDLRSSLHGEINRLPVRWRLPIVLCDLEGMSYEQAALQLGLTVPALRCRLTKGRQRLRTRMTQGALMPAVFPLLRAEGVVPAAWVRAALGHASGGLIPSAVAALMSTVSRGVFVSQLKAVAVAGTVMATAGFTVTSVGLRVSEKPNSKAPVVISELKESSKAQNALSKPTDLRSAPEVDRVPVVDPTKDQLAFRERVDNVPRIFPEDKLELRPSSVPFLSFPFSARIFPEGRLALPPAAKPSADPVSQAVARIAGALKEHPVPLTRSKDGRLLYLLDTETEEVTLLAAEPGPELFVCGSPEWSGDGKRILFDATPSPGNVFHLSRIFSLEAGEHGPKLTNLGLGNCPGLTPDGDRIAFLLNPGAMANDPSGVWMMKTNGEQRSLFCEFGRPKISPDGNQVLLISFTDPSDVELLDIKASKRYSLTLSGRYIYTTPTWVDSTTLIAAVGDHQGAADSIVFLDISNPEEMKVKEVLWRRSPELNVVAVYPIYSPVTKRCFFIGRVREGEAAASFYEIRPGQPGKPKKYENKGYGVCLSDPIFSPDGRYIVFSVECLLKP